MFERTPAERLDRVVDVVLAEPAIALPLPADGEARRLTLTAARVHAALPPIPAGARFEQRLGRRLAAAQHRQLLARDWFHVPAWVVVTGAASSAAAVGVTAYAVWRGSRHGGVRRIGGR